MNIGYRAMTEAGGNVLDLAMALGVAPITLRVVAARNSDTEGIPAVPMDTSVAVSMTMPYMPSVISIPKACAAKSAIRP